MISIAHLIPALQIAIGPVILISGIGLLLLTMTNRYGRIIDKSRILSVELTDADEKSSHAIRAQLTIMWQRARLVRMAIFLSSMSALAAAVMIIVLFFIALLDVETAWLVGSSFIFSMACLIASLIFFIYDINRSLWALKLELAENLKDPGKKAG
jgi:hypothetical protein